MRSTLTNILLIAAAGILANPLSAAGSKHQYLIFDHSPARAQLPFSDAVVAGNTLYVAGALGLDPKTLQVPTDREVEARAVMEAFKRSIEGAGFHMEELTSVQIFCTDLSLFESFNKVYRSYFHEHFPARAFIGVAQLARGAHFEVMGIAVR
jgi:2-iminobutanoate/2-iminopropanoate deaminase